METTHYLYIAKPPRASFVHDATEAEYQVIHRHFAFMDQVRAEGKLVLTGPALDGSGGIALFKVTTLAEAEALVARDPAVQAGLFTPSLHPFSIGEITP